MKPSAVLLIDLENFYCSREDYCRDSGPPGYDRARFAHDLDKLLGFARGMADGLPFTVRRAYANFNAARYPGGAPQHYLRAIPDELMRQGVEPVQVFRLSQSSGKNAADMRMAMDATALANGTGNVEHFVLVTGDADFIPVVLELKRHGYTVSVIGVTGATNALIQRFVDDFELFEDLLAAEEAESRGGESSPAADGLAPVAAAVRRLLARTRPLRFAAVKPLLSKELGHAFDPGLFGCDSTGEFLRRYQAELGVAIRQTQHDQEIDLPGLAPCVNGNGDGSKVTPRPAAKPEKPAPEPHTRDHYHQLLTGRGTSGAVRVPATPWPVVEWACEALAGLLAPPSGGPTHTTALLPKLIRAAEACGIPDAVRHVRMAYPVLRAGLPVQSADGVYALPDGTTGEHVRRGVLGYVGYVLRTRLGESGAAGDVRAESLAAFFDAGEALERVTAEVVAALAQPAPEPPAAPKPGAGADEVHTPASYLKLLKAGGAKGSETESFKVLPVPWPAVERVCADSFPLLCPAAGGAPMPRDELTARVASAGREPAAERYEQHVRRALGLLRVAGELVEGGGAVSLNPDVASAHDLRNRALSFLLQLLQLRLEERGEYDPIRPHAFAAALEAGSLAEALVEEVAPAIAWLYRDEPAAELPRPDGTECVDAGAAPAPDERGQPETSVMPAAEEAVEQLELAEPAPDTIGAPAAGPAPAECPFASPIAAAAVGSGVIDVAALTSEAVAAAAVESPVARAARSLAAEATDPPAAVPVADWLPDPDMLPPGVPPAAEQLLSAPADGVVRLPVPPLAGPPTPPVAKITQPPPVALPSIPPAPLPPESA